MNKILLIAQREFLTRVKKKSFLIMTLLGPLLITGFYGAIIYVSVNDSLSNETKKVLVLDESKVFVNRLEDSEFYKFSYDSIPVEVARLKLQHEDYFALLHITATAPDSLKGFELIGLSQPSVKDQSYIENQLENVLQAELFSQKGIDRKVIDDITGTEIKLTSSKDTGESLEAGNAGAATAVGFFSAFLIYIFIFIYGVQIMRGVLEEKTNRIAEVIISSVKPFELMMGKISGLAMVALLQFVVWILLTTVLGTFITSSLAGQMGMVQDAQDAMQQTPQSSEITDVLGGFTGLNLPLIAGMFVFYFLGGYLFYGALFAAIGSAVDNETDTHQFMFPITIPLIFAIVMSQSAVVSNPHGTLAFWLSVIPFTSPIAMMVRIPFGMDGIELQIILSMASMLAGIIFTTWLAGRIYRTVILMYGKKASWKELGKWLFYKG